jgi:uncharacterized protein YjbI with pentapeptide repeats
MFVAVLILGKCFKYMTQPLDFSNQDLRNRSFKGQNLAGANFRKADIRGCDFSTANLNGADFSGVIAGQSKKQIFGAVAGAVGGVFMSAFINAFVGTFVGTFVGELVGKLLGEEVMGQFAGIVVGAVMFVFGMVMITPRVISDCMAVVADVSIDMGDTGIVFLIVFASVVGLMFTQEDILEAIVYPFLFFLFPLFFLSIPYRFLMEKIRDTTGTSFKSAWIGKSKFAAAILNNCDFRDAIHFETDWTHAHFMRCNFSGFPYSYANLGNQLVRELCVSRIGINENFSSTNLSRLNLIGVNLHSANLFDANLSETNLSQADLTNANLCNVQAIKTDFIGVNLYSANLSDANLSETNLSQADLTNANLCNVQAIKTDFTGANLYGANLFYANLSQTNLNQADLTNANLCNVQAIKTDFSNANLSGACIENWAITPETNFTNVICSHIFLDSARTERQPASGFLEQGDFAKLVIQSTKSLNFFFHNGIDPQAFDFAFKKLRNEYPEMELSLKAVEDVGDGDRIVRFNTVSDAPRGEMHAQFTQDYEEMHQQLEASRNKVSELQQKLERFELEKQLAVAIAKLEERPTSQYLQNLIYHQTTQLGQQKSIYALNSQFGDPMSDKSIQSGGDTFIIGDKNKGVFGKDQQGVAGRDISGTVTNTIQQLRETNQPEAPQLSDLLEQLQKTVESSSELGEPEKQKALEYLNQIGEMSAKDPSQKKGMLPILLDAFTGVISKAANLIDPVKKIAAAILSIWQA